MEQSNSNQETYQQTWDKCLEIIEENVEPQTYKTWFSPIKPVKQFDNVLVIEVPSKFFYEWLEEHYVHLLSQGIAEAIGPEGRLEYSIKEDVSETDSPSSDYVQRLSESSTYQNGNVKTLKQAAKMNGQAEAAKINSFLNTNYTFDNFIEGDCNRLARSAGYAVAQKPGVSAFNPLMLYGGVGLGKTHLIQAIGNYIEAEKENGKKVIYISADKFINHFVDALKNHTIDQFNKYYMQIDILMIDDVQFFSGKEKMQEIFFHIFNHLHQSQKQIIMTCDRPPKDLIGLEDRLISRFKWGLIADLKQPDLETRMAIIQQKLQAEGASFPDEVVEYLANSIDTNVRELEGAIVSLIAQSNLTGGEVNLELARQTVQRIVQSVEGKEITLDEVQKVVSEYFGLSIEDLKAKTRKKEIVSARQIAMYFCKEHTGFSLKSIGYNFGGRDHSTVIHAIQAVNDKTELKHHVEEIKKLLAGAK